MRRFLAFLILMNIGVAAMAETTGRGGLYFGNKSLKHSDWGDLDSQPALGINLDVKEVSWPVWISAGYLGSRDKETVITSLSPFESREIEGKTSEFRLGVKKDFLPAKILRLSIVGGPAYMTASLDSTGPTSASDSDSAIGYWAGAEAVLYLGHVSLGVGYNYSHANVKLFNDTVDAGGSNLAFSLGFGW